jgi:aspartate carbamoyltransferase catalytic subunit
LEAFKIGMVGDLLNGRTVRSLAMMLSMYPGVQVNGNSTGAGNAYLQSTAGLAKQQQLLLPLRPQWYI